MVSGDARAAADDLSASILRAAPVDGLEAADQIALMGQGIPPDQVIVADIQRARTQWTRIREQRFLPADWFSEPAAAGAGPDTSAADYSDVAAGLLALIEDGAAEAEALSDPAVSDGAERLLRWRTFAQSWSEEIDNLESRLPSRPGAGADTELLVAIQYLEQAMILARALASSTEPPSVTDSRFEDGVNAALRAQQGFDDLAP